MDHSELETIARLTTELRRMRIVFGLSITAIALMLMVVLPAVIRNTVFRVTFDPADAGLFTNIIHTIGGEVPESESAFSGPMPAGEAEDAS